MSTVGTPDWQRGVVGAQVVFGPFSSAATSENIGLPANTKSIHILQAPAAGGGIPTVQGTTTNTFYPVFVITPVSAGADNLSHIAAVDPAADQVVTVTLPAAPSSNWYVVADQSPLHVADMILEQVIGKDGITGPTRSVQVAGQDASNVLHPLLIDSLGRLETADQVLDLAVAATGAVAPADAVQIGGTDTLHLQALRMNRQGLPYVIPSAPSIVTGDHPPNELLVASGSFAANTVLLAAPGAGKRYRIFAANLAAIGANTSGYIEDTVSGQFFIVTCEGASASLTYGPTGLPLSSNGAVEYILVNGVTMNVVVVYTLETI